MSKSAEVLAAEVAEQFTKQKVKNSPNWQMPPQFKSAVAWRRAGELCALSGASPAELVGLAFKSFTNAHALTPNFMVGDWLWGQISAQVKVPPDQLIREEIAREFNLYRGRRQLAQPVVVLTESFGYLSPAFRYLMAKKLQFDLVAEKYRIEGERQLQKRPDYADILVLEMERFTA